MHRRPLAAQHIEVGGLRLFVRSGGDADDSRAPVVCLHGALVSGRYMLPTAERLAARHRVIVPDLPGFGRSDHPAAPLAVPELADSLLAILDALGVRRVHLLGNSLGAQVAAEFAMRYPDRTASVILVGPTVDGRARAPIRQLWRLFRDAFLERPSLLAIIAMDIIRDGLRFAVVSLFNALTDRIEEKMPHIRSPVLIVSGTRDPLVPPAWSRALGALAASADVVILPGPHALNYSRPAPLTAVVLEFLERVA